MYSHEINNLLQYRNYLISNKEYFKICNSSPQINFIEYNSYSDDFYMKTTDNYDFRFKVYKKTK